MKIVFLLGRPVPGPTAVWTRIGFFARYFRKRGHEVDVVGIFSTRDLGESPILYSKYGLAHWHGVRIINIDVFSSMALLIPLLAILRPDVIVASVPPGKPAILAYLAARLTETKIVVDYRDEWEDYLMNRSGSRIHRTLFQRLKSFMTEVYKGSDLLVTVTPNLADGLLSRGIKQVKLVPNGAEIDVFKPHDRASVRKGMGLRNDDVVLVYSGMIGEYYRLDVVVRALAELPDDVRHRVKLVLLGRGPDVSEVMNIAERLSLRDNVIYLGVVSEKVRLAEKLSAADIGLIPYDDNPLWRNALPAKFFEYCACGIPVLATVFEDSMLSKMVKEHELGVITPPLDETKLSDEIRELAVDLDRRKRLGRNARRTVTALFDRERIAESFLGDLGSLFHRKEEV